MIDNLIQFRIFFLFLLFGRTEANFCTKRHVEMEKRLKIKNSKFQVCVTVQPFGFPV